MSWPSISALDADRRLIEDLVDHTPDIDPWCSGPDWVVPAHQAFSEAVYDGPVRPLLWSEPGTGAVLLGMAETPTGESIVSGLEPMWGFASPLLGPDLFDLGELAAERLSTIDSWQFVIIGGLPLSSDLAARLAAPFRSLGDVQATYGIVRQVADLSAGHDAWFAARSPRFRRSIHKAHRTATDNGVRFIDVSDDPNAFARCVEIERSSWKGRIDDGITSPGMHRFYEIMSDRLQDASRFRATIAAVDDQDVGFIFGGVRNGRYRGLQLSFVESARHLSISHLLQHHTIRLLERDGVHTYDMGMDMEYKQRWADRSEASMSLVVRSRTTRRRRSVG